MIQADKTQTSASVQFGDWIDGRSLQSIGTNHGSRPLPFQSWQRFKEAFAPELIWRAVSESKLEVRSLVDPFGGSGTTALAAQFLGVHPITAEVNPYLCDLIEAKLTHYEIGAIIRDVTVIRKQLFQLAAAAREGAQSRKYQLPPTFVEPGVKDRWIFSSGVMAFITSVLAVADALTDQASRRLIRVLIGGTLVGLSNVRVSGKGRRYRASWEERQATPELAASRIDSALADAIWDLQKFNNRSSNSYTLIRGDSRTTLKNLDPIELAVFSPPYPNSFDYTDVYNVELWILGYLSDAKDNRELRSATLTSHVQVGRNFAAPPAGSLTLAATIEELQTRRSELWDKHIPAMVGAYFADMSGVLDDLYVALKSNGEVWMVVGDSRYAGVDVSVAKVLGEIATSLGFMIAREEPFRSMRSSPQQGGLLELPETLLVLRKPS